MYSSGKTGKAWAKEWVKNRQLDDMGEARELIPIMSAIDSIVITDRQPNCINSVALERLSKKAYGIQQGCKLVGCLRDWKKPKDAGKDWKSKVDYLL